MQARFDFRRRLFHSWVGRLVGDNQFDCNPLVISHFNSADSTNVAMATTPNSPSWDGIGDRGICGSLNLSAL
jgi:hypothetical protein